MEDVEVEQRLMVSYQVQKWLTTEQIEKIEYSEYWNDEDKEKGKAWYILDDNFEKMERHLKKCKLIEQIKNVLLAKPLHGVGADLASGNAWAAYYLLKSGKVDMIYCVEYSQHRLLKLGPKVLKHYNVPEEKVVLCLGSFYELELPDNFLDFVFLSEAFHHADKPDALLDEVRRVLKPKGIVFVIGENIVPVYKLVGAYPKYLVKSLISHLFPNYVKARSSRGKLGSNSRKLFTNLGDVIPPDPVLGDHHYSIGDYQDIFSRHGFSVHCMKPAGAFILTRD